MLKTTMILRMQGYWAVGSGKGGGNEVDNRIDRDSDGLPYVPGKMLKGLIKDACIRLQNAGNKDFNFVDEVFGSVDESNSLNRTTTKSGKVYISDARLSPALRFALSKTENKSAKDNMTRNIYSTAINDETGTADDKSLRGYEVAVPMDLYATLENRITSEIKELYRIYESGEDKSDEISNKQALINTLDSLSKRNKEEPHDIESPYLTTDEFKDTSSKKESGFLKQYFRHERHS